MENTTFLPEICYPYKSLSLEQIFLAYADKQSVTGYVEKLIPEEEIVVVRLNCEIVAHMSYSEATMYPLRNSDKVNSKIPTNIYFLVGKNIRVKITRLNGKFITVSRKANMLEAFAHLCKCNRSTFHITHLERKSAFGDIGGGIVGRVIIDEVCKTHIKCVKEYLRKGDIVKTCLIAKTADNFFDLSYKSAFEPYDKEKFSIGMPVVGKVCDYVHGAKRPGYYVNIAPQVSGIMNATSGIHKLKYGTLVECMVNGVGENGLHLSFSKILD